MAKVKVVKRNVKPVEDLSSEDSDYEHRFDKYKNTIIET